MKLRQQHPRRLANHSRVRVVYIILALTLFFVSKCVLAPSTPEVLGAVSFRILDVRAEYGHLVVEVEHFKSDGTFAYFENYLFQGREGNKHPRVTNSAGKLLMDDSTEAPTKVVAPGPPERVAQYLPDGRTWLRDSAVFLDSTSILDIINRIHNQRLLTGWDKGQSRLTVAPRQYRQSDQDNVGVLVTKFRGLTAAAYAPGPAQTLTAYTGNLPPINPGRGLVEFGTVTTFYPDADPETSSVDGNIARDVAAPGDTYASIHDAASGTSAPSSGASFSTIISASATDTDRWRGLNRAIIVFDTASIPDGDTIDAATYETVYITRVDQMSQSIRMVTSTPATNTNLVTGDYSQLGTAAQANEVTLASLTVDSATYNTLTLNATGRGNISTTGVSRFGVRLVSDANNVSPTWVADNQANIETASAEEILAGDRRPRLVVTHTTPPTATITGTMTPSGTEQEVRAGGETIIITIANATWVAAGAAFDAQRQAIINGVTSAQAETRGWNAQVRDTIPVTDVVRTSDTVVTVTLSAATGHAITTNETITVTVPDAAHSGTGNITGTPTFQVVAGTETLTITGSLGGSGGVPSEIRAGGETIIYTVANTVTQAAGAAFDGTRQGVLDNIDSAQADLNGWDALRSTLPVTNVVRTSSTVITVTLSALTAYAIPATETLTATLAGAGALVYPLALTGTPTFNIVPSFVASGTRVSPAINLSSVTNVAYCALGWIATTPTSTTVTVDTSINGGSTYTTGATNGACPSGISVGATLAAITDFRIRLNLATTAATSTPLVTDLALVVEDASGESLRYELNTLPGVTITDRSGSSNTGTMSFPVRSSTISSTVGDLTTTRTAVTRAQALAPKNIASPVTGAAVDPNIFETGETGYTALPLFDIMTAISTAGDDLPIRFVWALFIGIGGAVLGIVVLQLTGSLLAAAIGMAVMMTLGAVVGGGLIPGWTVFVFVPIAGAFILMRPKIQL